MSYSLVTGACGGLGGAFVREIASRGDNLFLTGRSEERLRALAQALSADYPEVKIKYRACDLTDGLSQIGRAHV